MSEILGLIEDEIPHLRRFARYVVRDVDRADDLVQECLTRALAKIHTWTPGTNLRAWLFVILKNCHINEVRRERPTAEMPDDHPMLNVPANQEAHINLLEVRDAYLRLSDEHREVLLLVAIEATRRRPRSSSCRSARCAHACRAPARPCATRCRSQRRTW
ncbi:MAG: polymerase, sigma-24 subunit, subfamily [Geminicoccaceae bacterium]|nr:polymerase, sigma-24 subunit, subfamily [Geminicoccaceae bacterium]